jgi:hypothetical protein
MDFSNFPTRKEYLDKRLNRLYHEINDGDNDPSYLQTLSDCPAYYRLRDECDKPVAFLMEHMGRCRSLTVIFRNKLVKEHYLWLWSMFKNSAPQLVELITMNGDPQKPLNEIKWLAPSPLKRLVLQSWNALSNINSAYPKQLQSLEIPLGKPQNLRMLVQFTILRSLTLTFKEYSANDLVELGSEKLSLSSITFLALIGPIQAELVRIFDFPSVRDLHITRARFESFYLLPDISPIHLTWIVAEHTPSSELRLMLEKYTSIETLVVNERYMNPALKSVISIRETTQHRELQNLSTITFLDCNRRRTEKLGKYGASITFTTTENVTLATAIEATYEELISDLDHLGVDANSDSEGEGSIDDGDE